MAKKKKNKKKGVDAPTLEELRAQRGQEFEAMDVLYRTAAEEDPPRALTDEETATYDAHAERHTELETAIEARLVEDGAAAHAASHEALRRANVPLLVGTIEGPVVATRSLDEIYWATVEDVAAGTFGANGQFMANGYGARNAIEPTLVLSRSGQMDEAPLLADFSTDHVRMIRSFQKLVGRMILFGLVTGKLGTQPTSEQAFLLARSHPLFADRYGALLRAMDVDTAGEGADWVPTGIGASLHEKVRAAGKVAPLFPRINMPTNPWKWPLEGADATAFRVGEPTGDSETAMAASTPGTGGATFDAEIFGARALTSRSLTADSAIAILSYMENKLAQAFSDAEEKAILAGDSDGTHQDSDITGSTDARTAWDGLRKKGLAETASDVGNVALTRALWNIGRAAMGKWGLNPASLATIIGVRDYYNLLNDADFRTIDKFGPKAVILNGQLGAVDGVPVVVSEHIREDLNASGVEDGVTTNRSWVAIVNRGEFAIGQREALDIEVDDSVYRETYQRLVIGFQREDFQHIGDAAANDDVAALFNTAA